MAILPKDSSFLASTANAIDPLIEQTKLLIQKTSKMTMSVLDRYPPLKAFASSLLLSTFIPVLVFAGFALTCAGVIFGTSFLVGSLVFIGALLFGGFWLFWFLAGGLVLASVVTFWFTVGYFGYKSISKA